MPFLGIEDGIGNGVLYGRGGLHYVDIRLKDGKVSISADQEVKILRKGFKNITLDFLREIGVEVIEAESKE